MPGLFLKNDLQMAVDVAAYLGSLKETTSPVEPFPARTGSDDEAIQHGGELFERLGCIACHRFTEAGQDDEWRRVSLHFAKANFPTEALERFPLVPHQHHATTFMPDFRLTADEASLLATYIRQQSRGELNDPAGTQTGNIERGRRAFEQLKCGQRLTIQPDDTLPAAHLPSFPAYASIVAHGMAAEHGVRFEEPLPEKLDPDQFEIGRKLTLQNGGLDCRQCHGVGEEQPRGDASTQIALGINFALTRERL